MSASVASASTCAPTSRSATDSTVTDDAIAQRYEQVLAHLARQAVAQQREIQTLRAQVAAAQNSSPVQASAPAAVDARALEKLVSHMVRDCVATHTAHLEDSISRRLAARVRTITTKHVGKSIDHALDRAMRKAAPPAPVATLPVVAPPLHSTPVRQSPCRPSQTHHLSSHDALLCAPAAPSAEALMTPMAHHGDVDGSSPGLDVSPIAAHDAVALYSVSDASSSPAASARGRRDDACHDVDEASVASIADSLPMEFLMNVFTDCEYSRHSSHNSRYSPTVSTLTDRSTRAYPTAHRSRAKQAPAALHSSLQTSSRQIGSTLNDLTEEEARSPPSTKKRSSPSAADDVAQLIELFANTSVDM